ncbi:MAG: phosphate ABC transporter substrate-binding protein [Oscillospiraceae bacterium]|nr:phosphate ABC transporter substrate-binding protein [Oscillospiraceae bacterium]
MKRLVALILFLLAAISFAKFDQNRLIIAGSSCMGRMMTAITERYSAETGVLAQAQLGGTQLGLIALEKGACDIASVSRPLNEEEKEWARSIPIAIDAIAVIVHPKNEVNSISVEQLRAIYSGEADNWAQLGGSDMPIVVIGRESGSGTRAAFEQAAGVLLAHHDQEHSETGMLRTAVSMTEGAIGYISFDFITDDVKPLALNGVIPNEKTVLAGEYPITREFLLCVKKETQNEGISEFLRYCKGEKGKSIIKSLGMIPFYGEKSDAPR